MLDSISISVHNAVHIPLHISVPISDDIERIPRIVMQIKHSHSNRFQLHDTHAININNFHALHKWEKNFLIDRKNKKNKSELPDKHKEIGKNEYNNRTFKQ